MPRVSPFNDLAYMAELVEAQINPPDPVGWCREKAGVHLWSKQREICESLINNRRTAVKSGHGVGKSFLVSHLAAWWVATHPYEETKVISTAPSSRQVGAIIWEEIRKIHKKADLPGEVQRSNRWIIGDLEVGFGRKPQDYDRHAFQGIHAKYVLVIIDEACGVDEWLFIAANALVTGSHCRIIAIGNPDDPTSHFAKVCRPGSGWNTIRISVFDSPNFTGEEVTEDARDKLTNEEWVESMRKDVGEGSPTWIAKVEGEFPELDEFSTIPLGWVFRAQERWQDWKDSGAPVKYGSRYVVGADVARYGGDKNAFAHKVGDVITKVDVFAGGDTEVTADKIVNAIGDVGTAVIDTNGVGAGVFDKVRRRGKRAVPLNFANRTSRTDRTGQNEFYNLRAAAIWKLREDLDPSRNPTLCIPPDDKLAEQLAAPRWSHMAGGKIVIEAKQDVRKRTGSSPDAADAITLANWLSGDAESLFDESALDWQTVTDDSELDNALSWDEPEGVWRELGEPVGAGFEGW